MVGAETADSVGADNQGLSPISRLPQKERFINIHCKEVSPSYSGFDFLFLQVCQLDTSLFRRSDPGNKLALSSCSHTLKTGLN